VAQTVGFATLPPGPILHAQASVIAKGVQDHSNLHGRVIGDPRHPGILQAAASKKAADWVPGVG